MKALDGVEGIEFIIDHDARRAKECILCELGRWKNPQHIIHLARLVCAQEAAGDNRTAHEWAAALRKARLAYVDRISETVTEFQQEGALCHEEQ